MTQFKMLKPSHLSVKKALNFKNLGRKGVKKASESSLRNLRNSKPLQYPFKMLSSLLSLIPLGPTLLKKKKKLITLLNL